MRNAASMHLVLLALLGAACSPGAPNTEEAVPWPDSLDRTPGDLVQEWVEMWNAYDLDRVGELFLPEGRLTYFSSEAEGVIRGFGAVVEHHRGFGFVPGGQERGTRLWVEALTEDDFGSVAVLTGIWYFQRDASGPQEVPVPAGTNPPGSATPPSPSVGGSASSPPTAAPITQRGPVTFVCVLEGGRWWFAHMNFGNYVEEEGQGEGEPEG